jgi:hypothetical protein
VVGRASAVLSVRWALFGAVAAALVAYYLLVDDLWHASTWWDIAWLDFVLFPAVFSLVYLVLPLWNARGVLAIAAAAAVLAIVFEHWDMSIPANFAKLAATTFAAFWFLSAFESLSWVVLVAAIIPWVDAYSVWRGPTKEITTNHRATFEALSFAFPAPGGDDVANLGLPDLLFFALFLAATARWRLRPFWTWLAMVASFGATMAIAVAADLNGLPALPGLSIAFLAVNADLLWRRLRPRPA